MNLTNISKNISEVKASINNHFKQSPAPSPKSKSRPKSNQKIKNLSQGFSIQKFEQKYKPKSVRNSVNLNNFDINSQKKINRKISHFDIKSLRKMNLNNENQNQEKGNNRLNKSIEKIFEKYSKEKSQNKFGFFRKKIKRNTRKKSFNRTEDLVNLKNSMKQSNSQRTLKNHKTDTSDQSSHKREIFLEDVDGKGSNAQINLKYTFTFLYMIFS